MDRFFLTLLIVPFLFTSCQRSTDEIWCDTLTCTNHMERGIDSLCGNHADSRQVQNKDDFWSYDEEYQAYSQFAPMWEEYDTQEITMKDVETKREQGAIPSIQGFSDPQLDPRLAQVFKKVHFEYNSNLVKGKNNLETIQSIASYLKKHPDTYLFVEGHCDIRGPEAYNLALGSRRSNEIRSLLIKEGVHPDHVLTVSYGKERLIAFGSDETAHQLNRRGEFKVYER